MELSISPCPFCGFEECEAVVGGICWVQCSSCKAEGPVRASRAKAVLAWNGCLEHRNPERGDE